MSAATNGTPPHLAPGVAPGGLFIQIVTNRGRILDTAAVTTEAEMDRVAREHQELAMDWCDNNPGEDVWIHAYDGDTGEPFQSLALNSDMNAGMYGPIPDGADMTAVVIVGRVDRD